MIFRRHKKGRPAMSLVDTIKNELEGILDRHAGEIEGAVGDVAAVAASPLAAAAAAAVHIPPETAEAFAEFLEKMDADFGKLTPHPQPVDPTTGEASAPPTTGTRSSAPGTAADSSSSASSPSSSSTA